MERPISIRKEVNGLRSLSLSYFFFFFFFLLIFASLYYLIFHHNVMSYLISGVLLKGIVCRFGEAFCLDSPRRYVNYPPFHSLS